MAVELVLFILFLVVAIRNLRKFCATRNNELPPSPLALPIIGHFHLLRPLIHRSFHQISLRFGPIFSLRLGSVPCVVITSPEIAKEFLKYQELSFVNRIPTIAVKIMTNKASFGFAPHGPYWKFIRKLSTNELLSNSSMDKCQHIRNQEYLRLLRQLAKKAEASEAVNLSEELPLLGHNIMGQMMLGKYSSDSRAEEERSVVREAAKILGEFNWCDFNWIWMKLDLQGFRKRIEAVHIKFDALVEKIIVEREGLRKKQTNFSGGNVAEEKEIKGFVDIMLDLLEEGSNETVDFKFSRGHIKAIITDLFAASTDSTSISMQWALAELINHPEILKKAREEIDRVVQNGRLVGELDLPNLPYIQGIIKETLRLHPPLCLIGRKCVQQCQIGKYVIPKNTSLFVNTWAIGRDPTNWENPLEFMPERFFQLDGSDQKNATNIRGQHFQFLPFGMGRRSCPGLTLAMKMLPTVLAALIQCFDWKVVGTNCRNIGNDNNNVLKMDERAGYTNPRAHDLICIPLFRSNTIQILDL